MSYYVCYPEGESVVGDITTSDMEYVDVDGDSFENVIIEKEIEVKRGL